MVRLVRAKLYGRSHHHARRIRRRKRPFRRSRRLWPGTGRSLIDRFLASIHAPSYDAFARGDAAAMNACYATNVVFTDAPSKAITRVRCGRCFAQRSAIRSLAMVRKRSVRRDSYAKKKKDHRDVHGDLFRRIAFFVTWLCPRAVPRGRPQLYSPTSSGCTSTRLRYRCWRVGLSTRASGRCSRRP